MSARLDPHDLATLADLIAGRVIAALAEDSSPRDSHALLTSREVAERFGVSAEWVRENADRLGALRLGDGPRPRLRFDPELVAEALNARSLRGRSDAADRPAERAPRRRRSRGPGNSAGLLPVFEVNSPAKSEKVAGRRTNAPGPATRDTASSRAERSPNGSRSAARARVPRARADEGSRDG